MCGSGDWDPYSGQGSLLYFGNKVHRLQFGDWGWLLLEWEVKAA
jgi:hypothetical protein